MKSSLIIVTQEHHPGFCYAVNFVGQVLNWDLQVAVEEPSTREFPSMRYGQAKGAGAPTMAQALEYENWIHRPPTFEDKELPGAFPAGGGEFPIDLFGLVFWSLTRQEEYLSSPGGTWGRHLAVDSWAHEQGVLERPFVDEWIFRWARWIGGYFPEMTVSAPRPCAPMTVDIDLPFMWKHRPFRDRVRTLLGSLYRGDGWVWKLLTGRAKDPFDTFDRLREDARKMAEEVHWFVLIGNRKLRADRSLSIRQRNYAQLLKELDEEASVGIHPSLWSSSKTFSHLEMEKRDLERFFKHKIYSSRQHFLAIRWPATYQRLVQLGIRDEFSMGYADRPGFRAGTAYPFQWFDLERNCVTPMRVHPLIVMDVTLNHYLNDSPEEAIDKIEQLWSAMRGTGGEFTWLWHNSSFPPLPEWERWEKVYRRLLDISQKVYIS